MLEQLEAMQLISKAAQKSNALVVSEIGSQTTWLHESGDHDSYLYLSGPMGAAPSVAHGVAISNPDKAVIGLCGDGALAMNFSALVTAAHDAPQNLTLILMDNGVYDFTGSVPSPSSAVDWEKLIAGLPSFTEFSHIDEHSTLEFSKDGGLTFMVCKVKPASRKPIKFPFRAPEIAKRFKSYVTE